MYTHIHKHTIYMLKVKKKKTASYKAVKYSTVNRICRSPIYHQLQADWQ